MTEIEKQLKNVAFGGSWSEQILTDATRDAALFVLRRAVEDCMDQDVRTPDLHHALDHIRKTIGKGEVLAARFEKALAEPDPTLRTPHAYAALRAIERWVGNR